MADNSLFVSQQFINAASLNTLVSNVSGAAATFYGTTRYGGLAGLHSYNISNSGLVATVSLPWPFHVIFNWDNSTGGVAYAHGTTDGIDTQTYTVDFTPLVPNAGLPVTAYIILSHTTVRLNQYALPGPPPGHPDFNPNFQPYLAYSTISDSIAVTASTTPPDNSTTFELARITLAVGATGVGPFITTFQQRQSDKYHIQSLYITGESVEINQYAGKVLKFPNGGIYTLPPLSLANGEQYFLTTRDEIKPTIIQASIDDPYGQNFISGALPNPMARSPAIIVTPGGAVSIAAIDGRWQILSGAEFARTTMFRAMLVSDTNFYVDAQTGNDLNNGLSTGSPWKTLQFAHDFVKYNFDLAGFTVTFNCNGNFDTGVAGAGAWVGQRTVSSIVWSFSTGSTITIQDGSCFTLRNFESCEVRGSVTLSGLGTDSGAGCAILLNGGARARIGTSIIFGACGIAHNYIGANSTLAIVGNYTISAGAPSHYSVDPGGFVSTGSGLTEGPGITAPYVVTIQNSPTFSTAFVFSNGGTVGVGSSAVTFTGPASGQRYLYNNNGSILTGGSGPTYFPGSVSGSGTAYNGYQ